VVVPRADLMDDVENDQRDAPRRLGLMGLGRAGC
jgi:hypothetical protein